jgi:hypothetical protein
MVCRSSREMLVQTSLLNLALYWVAVCGLAGCHAETSKPKIVTPAITATIVDPTPGAVEIMSAKAQWKGENIVAFEIAYRFTSGSPNKNYMLNLGFPGTSIAGHKPMDSWEVKPEGTIKTGMPVADPEAKAYEVTFAEADSPDRGYTVISNKFTGEIEPFVESASK